MQLFALLPSVQEQLGVHQISFPVVARSIGRYGVLASAKALLIQWLSAITRALNVHYYGGATHVYRLGAAAITHYHGEFIQYKTRL